jgi:AcrR family transcriptional regulator
VSAERKRRDSAPARGRRLPAQPRRESILEVARHAFAARGYDGLRTQEIAKAAGVSEALIYQHFTSKRELYEEVVDRSATALREILAGATTGSAKGDRLERGLEAFVEFVADRSSGWSLLVSRVGDPEVLAHQRAAHRSCIEALTDLFVAESRERGGDRSRRQLEQLAEAIGGGAEALATWWSEHPKASRAEGLSMLVEFARRGLEESAPAGRGKRRGSA